MSGSQQPPAGSQQSPVRGILHKLQQKAQLTDSELRQLQQHVDHLESARPSKTHHHDTEQAAAAIE